MKLSIFTGLLMEQLKKGPAPIMKLGNMASNSRIHVEPCGNARYQVFHGELLLATFGNLEAAHNYATRAQRESSYHIQVPAA